MPMILLPSTLVENEISLESCLVLVPISIFLPTNNIFNQNNRFDVYVLKCRSSYMQDSRFMCLIMSKCTDNVSEI